MTTSKMVEIKWSFWAHTGLYGTCPLCGEAGIPTLEGPQVLCDYCRAKFKIVPGGPHRTEHETGGPFWYKAEVIDYGHGRTDRLNVTLHIRYRDSRPLTGDEKNAIIHRLIEKFDGAQDPALGTVVIPLLGPPLPEEEGPAVQLWIHDWE